MTLTEILVVMAIMSILAALIFAAIRGAINQGDDVRCISNLKGIHMAALAYASDNNGKFPDRHRCFGTGTQGSILPYMTLPADRTLGKPTALTCPSSHKIISAAVNDYCNTYSLSTYTAGSHYNKPAVFENDVLRMSLPTSFVTCASPSRTAMFMDGTRNDLGGTGPLANEGYLPLLRYPHASSINVIFVDGHIEKITEQYAFENLQSRTNVFWGAAQ